MTPVTQPSRDAALESLPPPLVSQEELFTPSGGAHQPDENAAPLLAALSVIKAAVAQAQAQQGDAAPAEEPALDPLLPPPGETLPQFLVRITPVVEGLLFASDHPVPIKELVRLLTEENETQATAETLVLVMDTLNQRHQAPHSGISVHEVAGGYALRTSVAAGRYLRRANQEKPFRMGRAALETLAIIAYRQPVTRAQLDELRGVDCSGAVKALLDKHLVRILGKAEEVGRPLLYGTTKLFLEAFNLRVLADLPTLREYQELSAENQAKVDAQAPIPALGRIRDLATPGARLVSLEAEQEGQGALHELDRALGTATTTGRAAEVFLKAGGKLPPGMDLAQVLKNRSRIPEETDTEEGQDAALAVESETPDEPLTQEEETLLAETEAAAAEDTQAEPAVEEELAE